MFENIGVIAAFGAMLCWGFGDFCIQKATRKLGDFEALFFIGLIGSVILFPFVFKELPFVFSNYNIMLALFFLGFVTLVVSIMNFQALKEGKLAIVEPILEFELPVTMVFSIILLQENITVVQLILSAVLFSGILLLSFSKFNFKAKHLLEKGVLLAIITAVGMGFLNFLTGSIARNTSPLLAIWSAWTVFAIFCFVYIIYKKGFTKMIKDAVESRKVIVAESVFDTAAWAMYAIAMVTIPISLATAISESYPAIAVLLGILVNREIVRTHQFIGMSIALIASIILAMLI